MADNQHAFALGLIVVASIDTTIAAQPRVSKSTGLTLVVVSHEMAFARALADSVHFVSGSIIAESGSAEEIFERPQTAALRQFMDSIRRSSK